MGRLVYVKRVTDFYGPPCLYINSVTVWPCLRGLSVKMELSDLKKRCCENPYLEMYDFPLKDIEK